MSEYEAFLHEQLLQARREYEKKIAPIVEQLAFIRQNDVRPIIVPADQIAPEILKQLKVRK